MIQLLIRCQGSGDLVLLALVVIALINCSVLNLVNFDGESLRPRRSLALHGHLRTCCHVDATPAIAARCLDLLLLGRQDQILEQSGLVLFGTCRLALAVHLFGRRAGLFGSVGVHGGLRLYLASHLHHVHLLDEEIAARMVLILLVCDTHTVGVRLLARGMLSVLS